MLTPPPYIMLTIIVNPLMMFTWKAKESLSHDVFGT